MINKIYCGDSLNVINKIPDNFIDLTVTSPPYDTLDKDLNIIVQGKIREYKGYLWDFKKIAKGLYKITKDGGIVVWIVGDTTKGGDESGTSFRQALYFKDIGFNLHDTMIYYRHPPYPSNVRYNQCFEYMFVFSKGKIKTFNQRVRVHKSSPKENKKKLLTKKFRNPDGTLHSLDEKSLERVALSQSKDLRLADNIWYVPSGSNKSTTDTLAFEHPAIFPEQLAEDHILSWTNENDLVYDPFGGSGTTGIMAYKNNRKFILSEISTKYCEIMKKRFDIRFNKKVEIERIYGKR